MVFEFQGKYCKKILCQKFTKIFHIHKNFTISTDIAKFLSVWPFDSYLCAIIFTHGCYLLTILVQNMGTLSHHFHICVGFLTEAFPGRIYLAGNTFLALNFLLHYHENASSNQINDLIAYQPIQTSATLDSRDKKYSLT